MMFSRTSKIGGLLAAATALLLGGLVLSACACGEVPQEQPARDGLPPDDCIPESDASICSRLGADCGAVSATDNCKLPRATVECGMCMLPQVCGGGGVANTCAIRPGDGAPTVDPDATEETKALFNNLRAIAPTHTMLGMENALGFGVFMRTESGGVDWSAPDGVKSDIRTICGAGPAVTGNDVSAIVGDWWIGNPDIGSLMSQFQADIRDDVKMQHSRGGIFMMTWHQSNPVTGEDYRNGPRELWRIVPPEACASVTAAVPDLVDCGTHFNVFRDKLDVFADWVKTLVDDNGRPIPIIFRPFHENNGGWFWWGSDAGEGPSSERYQVVLRSIWSWMVSYMSQVHGVHNLLWSTSPNGTGGWNPLDRDTYLSHTPGLELVDVLGYDFYATDLSGADRWGAGAVPELAMLTQLAEDHDKVSAMTEGGAPGGRGDYDCDFWTNQQIGPILNDPQASRIAWYMAWTNNPNGTLWGPVPGDCSGDDFRSVCDMPQTLLEGEADLYAGP